MSAEVLRYQTGLVDQYDACAWMRGAGSGNCLSRQCLEEMSGENY
jgi:hypothetical protein